MRREIEMAVQQLIGFEHARAGHNLTSLAEGMGMTQAEWRVIRKMVDNDDLTLHYNTVEELNNHFKKK